MIILSLTTSVNLISSDHQYVSCGRRNVLVTLLKLICLHVLSLLKYIDRSHPSTLSILTCVPIHSSTCMASTISIHPRIHPPLHFRHLSVWPHLLWPPLPSPDAVRPAAPAGGCLSTASSSATRRGPRSPAYNTRGPAHSQHSSQAQS